MTPDTVVDKNEILRLSGITTHHVTTLGLALVDILGCPVAFHLVENDFPIPQNGILGSDFFKKFHAKVDYEQNQLEWDNICIPFEGKEIFTIPPRAISQMYVKVANPEIEEGYIPRLNVTKGVYLGDALVTVRDAKAYLQVVNTTEEEERVYIPTIKIYEFEINENQILDPITDSNSNTRSDYLDNFPPNSNLESNSNSCYLDSTISNSDFNSNLYENHNSTSNSNLNSNSNSISKKSNLNSKSCFTIKERKKKDKVMEMLRLEHLNAEELSHVEGLIEKNSDCFHLPDEKLNHTNVLEHRIPTINEIPIHTRQYRFPVIHKDEINKQVNELLEQEIIKPSKSPYNTPVWIVPKKADSKGNKRWRMVLDFRELNEKTVGDAYPLPNITEILDQLGGAKYFSVLDLASGFHQIKMHPTDRHKTAFSTPHGHYEFDRMPFGLKNAPATFQRLMDLVLTGMQGNEIFVYLDDIVIYSSSLTEHTIKFEKLAKRLRQANLRLQPDKCEFLRKEVTYLGHIIGENGVRPDLKKVEAVQDFPIPKNAKNVKQFLGLAGYYRRFIKGFSKIAKPLTNLLKKDNDFKWEEREQESFEILKNALCQEPILQYPDFTKPFLLTTDASGTAIGAILSQGQIGKDQPISYASRVLNNAEKNYSTIEKELLALVYGVQHFRPYLYGKKFKLVTDHKPLTWLHKLKDPTSRLARWRIKLAEYDYEIIYKPGKINANADALSRNPTTNIYPIHTSYDEIEECPEDDEARQRNTNPKPLPASPRRGMMRDEPEPIVTGMQTRHMENSDGESIPFTKKELEEPPFIEHIIHAEIHNNPSDQSDNTRCLQNTETPDIENNIRNLSLEAENNSESNNTNTSIPSIIIPPDLLQIISNLEGGAEQNEIYRTKDDCEDSAQTIEDDKNNPEVDKDHDNDCDNSGDDQNDLTTDDECDEETEDERDEEDNDNDDDNDMTYNEFNADEIAHETGKRIMTRGQRHSIINSRDHIFMRKENYLYFLTTDGEPCDEGSRQLQTRKIVPRIKGGKVGNFEVIKKGNGFHLIFICKENIKDKVARDTILEIATKLRRIIKEHSIKIINIAKLKELDDISWAEILSQIRESILGTSTKLIICHGLVATPEIERRKDIIEEAHSSKIGGHKGITKTYNRIRQNFFWNNIKSDVRSYINQCLQCQTKKLVRVKTKQPMLITDTPFSSFEKISMDIVGPLPGTTKGNSYILTIQDHLTKFSLAIPLKSITAIQVADALLKYFICIFGAPKIILTDQGTNFMSNLMKRFAKQFKIKQYRTTAFYPQANGALERSHLVLVEYLKQYVDKFTEWDELLEYAAFSYNTSTHESTGYTPYELVFGKLARQPSSEVTDKVKERTYDDYLYQLITSIHNLQELARECLIASKIKSKYYYDKKINPQIFQINDQVFLLNEPKRGKLGDQYSGPHIVTDILPNGNIKIFVKGKSRIVHSNKLRKTRRD